MKHPCKVKWEKVVVKAQPGLTDNITAMKLVSAKLLVSQMLSNAPHIICTLLMTCLLGSRI